MMTIQDAVSAPANFMYLWADDKKFLPYIPAKYAEIIKVKKANQLKVIKNMAKFNESVVSDYVAQIRQAFIDAYDMTPAQALVVLAQGGTVAGKNWSKGVFGIGATRVVTFIGHEDVTVRTEDGHILKNGTDITDAALTVYSTVKKQTVAFQLFGKSDGITYMSQYNKSDKKYYAQSFVNEQGKFDARTGTEIKASDGADLWGNINGLLEKFLNWLISLFGGSNRELLNEKNTIPNQQQDGFVQEAGMGEAGMILLALVAGGALLANGGLNIKAKK